ncbi:MAG: nucleotidyltransferase family protein [Deltaproteobacteria bacterium]|nr:nucleotidyltransferase family protein [Deltaproteobacteria bacterium]
MNTLAALKTIGQMLSPVQAELPDLELDWEMIIAVSSRHLITPAIYPALVRNQAFESLEGEVKQYLSYIHELNTERNAALIRQGVELARALNGIGIVPVMLKGMAYLFENLHGNLGARVVGDIDLFVPGDHCDEAVTCLESEGYTFLWEENHDSEGHHHLIPMSREGSPAVVELHTKPIKKDFSALLSVEDFLREIRTISYQGAKVGVPSLTHQVVICIEHEGLANRDDDFLRVALRGLHDLSILMTHTEVDWRQVKRRFRTAGLDGTLTRYLALVQGFFLTSPDGVSVHGHLPLFVWAALRFPRYRKSFVWLFLGLRALTDKRIREAALSYGLKLYRNEETLASLKRQMANRE